MSLRSPVSEHTRSWTSFWGQISSFPHVLQGAMTLDVKKGPSRKSRFSDLPLPPPPGGPGFQNPTDLGLTPSPATCLSVTLDLVFMATPCLPEAFLEISELLHAKAGAQ